MRSAVITAAAMAAAVSLAIPAQAEPGPPAGSRATGTISVQTGKGKLCLTALGSGVVVARPCVSRADDEEAGQAWLLSRYGNAYLAIQPAGSPGKCLGDQPGGDDLLVPRRGG
jgi:hypothetical protein